MDNKWFVFECDCNEYLNEKFQDYGNFFQRGESDSTQSDIFVITRNNRNFYIEVKLCPAQCGQFVLIPDDKNRQFVFSKQNASSQNQYTEKIIQYMNARFDEFKNAGTAGLDIHLPQETFAGWIIENYKSKNTELMITNNYTILKLSNFADYFNINAKYRIKKSGSSAVGKSNVAAVKSYLAQKYPTVKIDIQDDKVFLYSSANLHNQRFSINNNDFMISARDGMFEIRKLSKTNNANVIFSVTNKSTAGMTDNEFISFLLEY